MNRLFLIVALAVASVCGMAQTQADEFYNSSYSSYSSSSYSSSYSSYSYYGSWDVIWVPQTLCYDLVYFYEVERPIYRTRYVYTPTVYTRTYVAPTPSVSVTSGHSEVCHYTVDCWICGESFRDSYGDKWKLVAGSAVSSSSRSSRVTGYRTWVRHLDGSLDYYFHEVSYSGGRWKPTGRIFE